MMNARIFFTKPKTDVTVPRWLACRSISQSHTSARFIHDAEVGVKWRWIRGFAASRIFAGCTNPAMLSSGRFIGAARRNTSIHDSCPRTLDPPH